MAGPNDFGVNAPNFELSVNDNRVSDGVRSVIKTIEYESSDGMADCLKLTIDDPQTDSSGRLLVRDSKLFLPGNELSLWMGYGAQLRFIGRAIIRRVRPSFPANGMPSMEVIAYSKDSMMSDTAPENLRDRKVVGKKAKRVKVVKSKAGRRFQNFTYSDAVASRAGDYGFTLDVDPTGEPPSAFIQKAHMTDYDFVVGLSNITGFVFWVDANERGEWTLHFKDPYKLRQAELQEKEYTFRYNAGDDSSLLSFEAELAITHAITSMKVEARDWVTGKIIEAKIEEENDDSPDVIVTPGKGPDAATLDVTKSPEATLSPKGNEVDGAAATASDVKIFLGEFSFEIKCNRTFETPEALVMWAHSWFRRYRELFILGNGTVIGIETLKARQIHILSGLGTMYDGYYYFTRARHVMSASSEYVVEFSARRIVPDLPPVKATETASEVPVQFEG